MNKMILVATGGYDHLVRLWNIEDGNCYRIIKCPETHINALSISPDRKYIAVAGNQNVKLYNLDNFDDAIVFKGHTGNVTSVGFDLTTKWMFTSSEDRTLKIWDIESVKIQRDFNCKKPVNCAVLHPNQKEIITGDDFGSLKMWDMGKESCSMELIPEENIPCRSVALSSDGKYMLLANESGFCYIWDILDDIRPIAKIHAHETYITKVVYSSDCKYFATSSSDKTLKVWDSDTKRLVIHLKGHEKWVWDCKFSTDSKCILSGSSDGTARLWDISSGNLIRIFDGLDKAVIAIELYDFEFGQYVAH